MSLSMSLMLYKKDLVVLLWRFRAWRDASSLSSVHCCMQLQLVMDQLRQGLMATSWSFLGHFFGDLVAGAKVQEGQKLTLMSIAGFCEQGFAEAWAHIN